MSEKQANLESRKDQVSFVQPHFIKELGEFGLTAAEIAQSLGVSLNDVHQKLRRITKTKVVQHWLWAAFTVVHEINGLPYETYALNTEYAKVFVARWENEIGDAYLKFLFQCERLVLEEVPKLRAELTEATREIKSLRRSRQKARGKLGEYAWIVAGFDANGRTIFKQVPRNCCTEMEICQGYVARNRRQVTTLIKRSKEAIEFIVENGGIVYFDDHKTTCEKNPKYNLILPPKDQG